MNNRLNYIDIAKAFGIFFVVASHAYVPFLRNFGYMFMVPLFFFLNGYIFNMKNQVIDLSYCKNFFIKKIKTLWLPFFLYSCIFAILHNLFLFIGLYTNNYSFVEAYTLSPSNSMWRWCYYKLLQYN